MVTKSESTPANIVYDLVPATWKCWALLFKAIANGHLSEFQQQVLPVCEEDILNGYIENTTFEEAIDSLFKETCEDISKELPTNIYSLNHPVEALAGLRFTANEILQWYHKALHLIDGEAEYAASFKQVANNCELIIKLLDCKPDAADDEDEAASMGDYFHMLDLRPLYRIVNGTCLNGISFDVFYNVLNCNSGRQRIEITEMIIYNEENGTEKFKYTKEDESEPLFAEIGTDYSEHKITPHPEYAMALYTFFLLLLYKREWHQDFSEAFDDNGGFLPDRITMEDESLWAKSIAPRIDWCDYYHLREDSWKTGYFSSNECPSSYTSGVKGDDRVLLKAICNRYSFEDIFCSDSIETVKEGAFYTNLQFEQYKYIYENQDKLETLHRLLLQELDYLFNNCDDIIDCYYNRYQAERQHDEFSKWRFDAKQHDNESINELYSRQLSDNDYSSLHRLLFARRFYAYEYLWEQPMIYLEVVRDYLHNCVLQDEALLVAVKRSLEDTPIQRSLSNFASNKTKRKLLVEEAIRDLQEQGIIDEQCSILPKKAGGTNYKTMDLLRILVGTRPNGQDEYARPRDGWRHLISDIKYSSIPKFLLDDKGKFNDVFYRSINDYDMLFVNGIDWNLYDSIFFLKEKPLSGDELRRIFSNKSDYRQEILLPIIRKYENQSNDSFVRVRK